MRRSSPRNALFLTSREVLSLRRSPTRCRCAERVSDALWLAAVLSAFLALPATAHSGPWTFTDVTAAAGVSFSHAYVETEYNEPRLIAGGAAAGDYDGDGWLDLYAVRGTVGKN